MTTVDLEDDVAQTLPPASILVYLMVVEHAPISTADIAERACLNRRTVDHALRRLRDRGLVDRRRSSRDARAFLHFVPCDA